MAQWDAFISHASEDKERVARPMTAMLQRRGLRVWLDENELKLGDSLLERIIHGLAESDFGVLILSRAFFSKSWTKLELDGILNRSFYREKYLVPVWHEIDAVYMESQWPTLLGRLAVPTTDGLERVVERIMRTVRPEKPVDLPTFGERQAFADEFVLGLRSGKWTGRAFDTDIGKLTMDQIRGLLQANDSDPLLSLLKDGTLRPDLRNRAASLLFGPRLSELPEERRRVSADVDAFYHAQVTSDDWRVLRAIALAVAYELNDPSLLVDWLRRIVTSGSMVEANLAMSDSYYGGKRQAVETYLGRVKTLFRARPAGRIWEVFYLGRRAVKHDADVIGVLTETREHATDESLRQLADESIALLTSQA